MIANVAPCGSVIMAIRPYGVSTGPPSTVPPRSAAAASLGPEATMMATVDIMMWWSEPRCP